MGFSSYFPLGNGFVKLLNAFSNLYSSAPLDLCKLFFLFDLVYTLASTRAVSKGPSIYYGHSGDYAFTHAGVPS